MTALSVAEPIIANPVYVSDKYAVVPQFVVPSTAYLTRWQFAAQLTPSLSPLQNPQLQVWRREPNAALEVYKVVHSTNTSLSRGGCLGIWEYVLVEPTPVQAGDVLGFYQPAMSESQLRLAFVTEVCNLKLIDTEPFLCTEIIAPLIVAGFTKGI